MQKINKRYKLAIISPVPFYYHTPFYRKLAESPKIDLTVYYCSDETLKGGEIANWYKSRGQIVNKDGLLTGYKYKLLKNYSFDGSFMKSPFGLVNFGLWNEIKNSRFDAVVIQAWNNFSWFYAFIACLIFKTPIFFMSDANYLSEAPKSIWKKKLKKLLLQNFLFKKATGFFAQGVVNKQFYKNYGVPDEKIVKMHYTWGYEWFLAKANELKKQREKIRSSLNIRKEDFVLLYVGRLAKEKLPFVLLRAYDKVDFPNKRLFIVGDGPWCGKMEQEIEKLKIRGVSFIGFQPRESICNFYAAADALVLASEHEPWGMVVNEAMCFGLPLVISDKVGAGLDLVKNGYNGFIVRAGDSEELSLAIEKTINLSPRDRFLFGLRSKKIIEHWIYDSDAVKQLLKALKLIKNRKL